MTRLDTCELCGWSGVRYWSHHRGRNGQPPSNYRHAGGCLGKDKVRALNSAYFPEATPQPASDVA